MKRPEKCWHFWNEMQGQRGLEPNDIVFGCMLDALVCNGQVDEAVKLFVALLHFVAFYSLRIDTT